MHVFIHRVWITIHACLFTAFWITIHAYLFIVFWITIHAYLFITFWITIRTCLLLRYARIYSSCLNYDTRMLIHCVLNYDTRVFIYCVLNYDTRVFIRRVLNYARVYSSCLNYDTRVFIRHVPKYDTRVFIHRVLNYARIYSSRSELRYSQIYPVNKRPAESRCVHSNRGTLNTRGTESRARKRERRDSKAWAGLGGKLVVKRGRQPALWLCTVAIVVYALPVYASLNIVVDRSLCCSDSCPHRQIMWPNEFWSGRENASIRASPTPSSPASPLANFALCRIYTVERRRLRFLFCSAKYSRI